VADDVRGLLIQKIKESGFIAIQFDESTEVWNLATVFMFRDIYIQMDSPRKISFLQASTWSCNKTTPLICFLRLRTVKASTENNAKQRAVIMQRR
jgi:hypothetical protein